LRPGIRLYLLLALGTLLVLAFAPLFFAVSSLTRATMTSAREASARALGRAIAGHVIEARVTRTDAELQPLLDAQVGESGVAAIGVYDGSGALVVRGGERAAAALLPARVQLGAEELLPLHTGHGAGLLVIVPAVGDRSDATGAVAALLRTDPTMVGSARLIGLVALYTGVGALALLVFAYSAMTRLVVQPIDELVGAARRVADGARQLEVPRSGAREVRELGESLTAMMERMRADEEALRAKIAEVERYAADLKGAQDSLVRSERLASVGRLAAGLAHEIGNPISAILGFQDLLIAGGLDEDERRDFLERMKRETERIHKVLRDLLDFARPAARAPAGGREPPGSIGEALGDVVALVTPQKGFREIALAVDVAPDLPAVALSHERLVQVLLNLLLNAADAVPERGGRVTVRARRGEHGCVRVEVDDNGPGIAPSVRAKLFEPFVTTKEVGKGTGLGLAVCRGLVEAAGGTIAAEEAPEGGARFVLEVPEGG
jgi:signal transduction histidine kinase